jgi:hypothetical protein
MQMAAMMTEAQFVSAIFLKTSMTIWKLQPINHWKEIIFDVKHQKNVVTLLIRQMRSYHRCTRGYPLDNFVRKTLTPFPPPRDFGKHLSYLVPWISKPWASMDKMESSF